MRTFFVILALATVLAIGGETAAAVGDGIRRNVATISQEERNRLRDAFIQLHRRFYPDGVSYWFKQDEIHDATHVHSFPPWRGIAFLPWHRELVNRLEALLREIDPTLSLHYWDWTTDPTHSPDGRGGFVNLFSPDFMGAANGPAGAPWLSAGFYNPTTPWHRDATMNPADPPRALSRAVQPGPPNLGTSDSAIIRAETYPEMRRLLEGAHNAAHGYIGGTLGDPHLAFRDPFVFLLHSNTDRLFALWQLQAGKAWRLDPEQVYGAESNTDVDPSASIYDPGILTLMDPWAGNPNNHREVHSIRPWAPPENEQGRPENLKNSKHPLVVNPPFYDTNAITGWPTITSPTPGSTLSNSYVTFRWTANGANVRQWALQVGTQGQGSTDILNRNVGTNLFWTVSSLPQDHQVYVRLWFLLGSSGIWHYVDFQYAGTHAPTIISPIPYSTLSGSTVIFQWRDNGAPVTMWWLKIGTAPGKNNICEQADSGCQYSFPSATVMTTVTTLPRMGETLYAQLGYKIGQDWHYSIFNYYAID